MRLGQTITEIRKERNMTLCTNFSCYTTDGIKLGERKELSGFGDSDFYE